jgi:hypothetical protein
VASNRRIKILAVIATAAIATLLAVFPAAKRHLEAVNCGNQICSICYAAQSWAGDNGGSYPSELVTLSNEINSTKILICPADPARYPAANWSSFTSANSSYEIVPSRWSNSAAGEVFLRCKVHGHLRYADGTVFDGAKRRAKAIW